MSKMSNLKWSRFGKQYKVCMITVLLLSMALFLSGCSLAKEDAGEEEAINSDRLVGVVITTEHLDEQVYATVDKHDSEEPLDWEISFEGVDGINFINVTWRDEKHEPFSMISMGDEIGDIKQHFAVTDEGDFMELAGTLYLLLEEAADEVILHLNPVYETTEGEFYVTTGNGFCVTEESGDGASMSIENKTTIEVTDGKGNATTETYGMSVQVSTEVFSSEPSVIRFCYMDENLGILSTQEFEPGKLPEQVFAEERGVCVIVETEWADGNVTRELIDLEKDESVFVETFYMKNEHSLTKQSTEIIWK